VPAARTKRDSGGSASCRPRDGPAGSTGSRLARVRRCQTETEGPPAAAPGSAPGRLACAAGTTGELSTSTATVSGDVSPAPRARLSTVPIVTAATAWAATDIASATPALPASRRARRRGRPSSFGAGRTADRLVARIFTVVL